MKNLLFIAVSILFFTDCVFSQKIKKIPKDTQVSLLDMIWLLDKENIYDYYPQGKDFFYRAVVLREPEGISNLEGESLDHIYLLKGEYGEYPDGQLYDLGRLYAVENCKFENGKLIILYNGKLETERKEIKLP